MKHHKKRPWFRDRVSNHGVECDALALKATCGAHMATWLREWLDTCSEKVLFGTDGNALSQGWNEST